MKPTPVRSEGQARGDRALEAVALAAVVALPVIAALAHAPLVDDGARDASLLRALGSAWAGAPPLDAWIAAPFVILPVGTLIFRLTIASALAVGVAGAGLFVLVRRLAALVSGAPKPRLTLAVATLGSLAATLATPWQLEGAAPLGTTTLAAALLVTLAWTLRPGAFARLRAEPARLAPFVAVAGALALYALLRRSRAPIAFDAAAFATAAQHGFERARIAQLLVRHVGTVTSLLALGGLVVALVVRPARIAAGALGALVVVALAMVARGATAGPERFDVATLVATSLLHGFAALGVAALVRWVASLRVPLAAGSAAMVALLAAAFPAIAFDEASLAHEARAAHERIDWASAAVGMLPSGTVVIGEDPRVMERLMVATLVGESPSALAFVPLYDVGGRLVRRELARSPAIVPLVRDMTLSGFPTEVALSNLAAERSVAMTYSSRWERALARHLVPAGALDRFEPEPRGIADRRIGMDDAERALAPLGRRLDESSARTLGASTSALLAWRVEGLLAIHDRELAPRALDAMRAFDPDDARLAELEAHLSPNRSRERRDVARR